MREREMRDWESGNGAVKELAGQRLQSQLISTTIAAPGLTPQMLLRQAQGQERFFWQAAGQTAVFAGFGVAADLRAWGPARFESIQQQAQALFSGAHVEDAGQPLAAPRLFGGFSFREDFTPDNTWAFFHPAQFILPHYQLAQIDGESWLTLNAVLPPEERDADILPQLRLALNERYRQLQTAPALASAGPSTAQIDYPMSYESWQQMVRQALYAMRGGALNKVVLSRVCEIRFDAHVAVDSALHYLAHTYADCYCFLFEPRPFHAFYGATPELLAQVQGHTLTTMGLASSIRRGQTAVEDEALAQELLASHKDLYEHAVVVDSIRRRLAPVVSELIVAPKPEVLRLGYIQHLYTPLYGRLQQATGILPIIELLHPTPALGGTPRHLALPFISEAEPVPRGWYAAPIGCIDHNLDGEFGVAIRSAIAQDRRVWLHAGAGIVADSDPQKEWQETALKFKPMLHALGIVNGEL